MKQIVYKTVSLNLLPLTKSKERKLFLTLTEYCRVANEILSVLKSKTPTSSCKLHHLVYPIIRSRSGLPAQLIQDIRREVWGKRKRGVRCFRKLPISYNVPRSGSLKTTARANPIFTVATINGRVALPIKKDNGYQRFLRLVKIGYNFTHFKLFFQNTWVVQVVLKREFEISKPSPSQKIIGIDIGTNTLAAVTVYDPVTKRSLKQLYFGRDIWQTKRNICIRRSKLQAHAYHGSKKARRGLRHLDRRERNFNQTRCYQIAHQIVTLAEKYGAVIAIEDLTGIGKSKLSRKVNRKVKRTPFYKFGQILQHVAWQKGISVETVNANCTSQICSRCGNRGARRDSTFECKCGFTTNADRNASVNIAKLLWERLYQNSQSGVVVSQPVWHREGSLQQPLLSASSR